MAERKSMTSAEVVAKTLVEEHPDLLRESVAMVAARPMEAEISAQIGAGKGEIAEARSTHRNGYRPRPWATRVGEVEPAVPRERSGESYFPSFLEPRKRSEKALLGVVMEAYVDGVSTRKVDHLVSELGIHMSKDQVSRICSDLDDQVEAFRKKVAKPSAAAARGRVAEVTARRRSLEEQLLRFRELDRYLAARRQADAIFQESVEGYRPGQDAESLAALAAQVEQLLIAWHFPVISDVRWERKADDLVIHGKQRRAFGKGVRAITVENIEPPDSLRDEAVIHEFVEPGEQGRMGFYPLR